MKGKRLWWILGALGIVLAATAVWLLLPKAPQEQPRSIMVGGIVYDCTEQETEAPLEQQIIGHVSSTVERTQLPAQDGQTNFSESMGQPYAQVEGQVALYYEGAWHLCVQVYG